MTVVTHLMAALVTGPREGWRKDTKTNLNLVAVEMEAPMEGDRDGCSMLS
jgi:hypothetical protein